MTSVLVEGVTCTRIAGVTSSAVLVDARVYYKAFYRAALAAERYILLSGWQFDSEAPLLRGEDAAEASLPTALAPFLSALCERRTGLRVYLLAWDYSVAYALEREWLQELKFALSTPSRVRFEFDTHPHFTGSHHQKFVVIDGAVAFAGGMDICDERWDDRDHAHENPLRVNSAGEHCRPNHEVQSLVTGEAAGLLGEIFQERWRAACGETLELAPAHPEMIAAFTRRTFEARNELPLAAERVAISRTAVSLDGAVQPQILRALQAALASAERVIYVETQYFTSRSLTRALLDRFHDETKPKLAVVVVLPKVADSTKEAFAIGETQHMVLGAIEATARATGHEVRFACSVVDDGDPRSGAVFVHSKVAIVDDWFLYVGSANFTERSMGFDTELGLVWEAESNPALARDIRRVRASLLAEHAQRPADELDAPEGIIAVVDRWLSTPSSRLRACHFDPSEPNLIKSMMFDPGGPHEVSSVDAEPASPHDRERFARGAGRALRELSRRAESPKQ